MSEVRETSISMALWHKFKRYWNRRKWEKKKRNYESITVDSTLRSVEKHQALSNDDKVCVYSSFDSEGIVHSYVFEQLQYYRNHGFKIVFVSTSPTMTESDRQALRSLCSIVIVRRNFGHDFCSWKLGLSLVLDAIAVDQLLLVNDSVFGPFNDFLRGVRAANDQIIGVTDSFEISYHLQSYFVLFGADVVRSEEFRRFIDSIAILYEKEQVVIRYEIGLTTALKEKFRVTPLYSFKDSFLRYSQREDYEFKNYNGGLFNPTELFWDFLLADGFPFLKRSLLAKNYFGSRKVNTWFLLVQAETHRQMISDYIRKKAIPVLY